MFKTLYEIVIAGVIVIIQSNDSKPYVYNRFIVCQLNAHLKI